MDRVIPDGKIVLMMLAMAALVYFASYNFVRSRPPQRHVSTMRTLVPLVLGTATGWLLYRLHVSPYVIIALAIIGSIVSAFIERRRAQPVS